MNCPQTEENVLSIGCKNDFETISKVEKKNLHGAASITKFPVTIKNSSKGLFCASEVSGRERFVERPKWQSDFRALQQESAAGAGLGFSFSDVEMGQEKGSLCAGVMWSEASEGKSSLRCHLWFCWGVEVLRGNSFCQSCSVLASRHFLRALIHPRRLFGGGSVAVWKLIPPNTGWGRVEGSPNCDNPPEN